MNTKTILAVIAVVVVVAIGYVVLHPSATPNSVATQSQSTAASSTSEATHPQQVAPANTRPVITVGTSTPTVITFDPRSLTSTSTYPVITGTANVPDIGLIINNSKGVGIVGTKEISIVSGHWSYAPSVAFPPGNYTLVAFVGKNIIAGAELTVSKKP